MVLGMSIPTFTLVHVLISLAGIATGFVVLAGLMTGRSFDRWTAVFLATTVLTSATGFLFPIQKITPGIVVGILSMVVLALAIAARYPFHLQGSWRWIFVVSSTIAQYFNVFVLIVQSFQKVPALNALAPTQSEPAFKITQLLALAIFIALGVFAGRGFRVNASSSASAAASGA